MIDLEIERRYYENIKLTITYGNNIVAMLQAYALNKILTEIGNDCYFLPFMKKPLK